MTSVQSPERVRSIVEEYRGAPRSALIPVLQRVQEAEGYLSRYAVREIGLALGLPVSKIFGVATFYNQFRFVAPGRYHLMLCRGTACHVKGSLKLLEALTRLLGIRPGQTTRDGLFSLEVVACMGACGLAPALSIAGEIHAQVTPRRLEQLLDRCRAEAALQPEVRDAVV
jgi:NADH:ubiquinone oxidoreductase subunit E